MTSDNHIKRKTRERRGVLTNIFRSSSSAFTYWRTPLPFQDHALAVLNTHTQATAITLKIHTNWTR